MIEQPTKKELLQQAKRAKLVIPKKVTKKILIALLDESKSGWDNWPYSSTPPKSLKQKPEVPETEAPQPPSSEPKPGEVCDTCNRTKGAISKCSQCGKSYCTLCRTPYTGKYSNCQHCGASDY